MPEGTFSRNASHTVTEASKATDQLLHMRRLVFSIPVLLCRKEKVSCVVSTSMHFKDVGQRLSE